MFRTALRSLRAHALRFLLSGVAVVLGVAFVTGALLYGESATSAAARTRDASQPDVSAVVSQDSLPPDQEPPALGPRLRDRLAKLPGVAGARGVVEGSAFVVGPDGRLTGSLPYSSGVNYRPGSDGEDPRYPLVSGRGPRGSGEVALDRRTAERAGHRVGDTVRVVVRGEPRTVRLAGIFTAHDSRLGEGGTLTAFDTETALRDLAPLDARGYSSITVRARPGVSDDAVTEQVNEALPEGARALPRDAAFDSGGGDGAKTRDLLLSFAAVVLLVSALLIANTFTMLSVASAREHALLRIVGATRAYVQRLVLTQALLVGAVASVVGYAAGTGLGAALKSLFPVASEGVGAAPMPLFSPTAAVAALAVGVGITALAAWFPARRAARVSPMAALRTGEPPAPASLRRRTAAGFAVIGLGALGAVASTGTDDLAVITLAGAVVLGGLVLLAPWCAVVLAGLLRGPMRRLAGVGGTLAVENARRNPRRTAATASALMTGLMLISAATVGVSSMSHMEERDAAREATSDLRVEPVNFAQLGQDTARRIAKLPDAASVDVVPGTRVSDKDVVPPRAVLVDAKPGRTEALREGVVQALDNPALVVRDRDEIGAEASRLYEPFLNMAYALLSVSVLIGALGVLNTMAMSVRERIREIGLLRAVGLDRRGTASVVRLEAVLLSLLGAVLGVTSGAALGATAVLGQEAAELAVPWARLALLVVGATLLGTLTALFPARQASRVPVLHAVSTDGA